MPSLKTVYVNAKRAYQVYIALYLAHTLYKTFKS